MNTMTLLNEAITMDLWRPQANQKRRAARELRELLSEACQQCTLDSDATMPLAAEQVANAWCKNHCTPIVSGDLRGWLRSRLLALIFDELMLARQLELHYEPVDPADSTHCP